MALNKGFGPGVSRLPTTERIKDTYGHGYPSNSDSGPSSITEQHLGAHTHDGRAPPSLGSSTFLYRPVSNGKPSSPPSILAGRKTTPSSLDTGKLIDGTSAGGQPNGQPHFTGSHDDGRGSSGRPSFSNVPSLNNVNGGSTDSPSHAPQQTNRGGTHDSSTSVTGYPDGRSHSNAGLQPIDGSRNGGASPTRQSTDAFGQTHGPSGGNGAGGEHGSGGERILGGSSHQPSTDAFDGLRKVFKLPPGLCLVRCDTLRPGQVSLNPDLIRGSLDSSDVGKLYIEIISIKCTITS